MTPIADWRAVLRHAWSVRLIALSILLSGLEAAVQFLHGVLPVSDGTFALLAFLTTTAALVVRFIAQRKVGDARYDWDAGKVSPRAGIIGASAAAVIAVAVTIVQPGKAVSCAPTTTLSAC